MNNSLNGQLKVIKNSVSGDMISEDSFEELSGIAGRLPSVISGNIGFETELWNDSPGADFFLMLTRDSDGTKIIRGDKKGYSLHKDLTELPEWEKIGKLCSTWDEPESILSESVRKVWLEFDLINNPGNLIPGIFLNLHINKKAGGPAGFKSSLFNVLDTVSETFYGVKNSGKLRETLNFCFEALPEKAVVPHIGIMLSRTLKAYRINLGDLEAEDLLDYLQKIKWPGDIKSVKKQLDEMDNYFDYYVFGIDVGEKIYPTLGFESYFQDPKPVGEPRWAPALDYLEKKGMVTKKKKEALLDFPGQNVVVHFFPVYYIKGINHIKLSYVHPGGFRAKAYTGFLVRDNLKKALEDLEKQKAF